MEIHDMQNMLERIEWSKTFQGKYFNFLGYFFSLYCTWKIFISTVNIVFDRVGRLDPITKGNYFSQQFSLYRQDSKKRLLKHMLISKCTI